MGRIAALAFALGACGCVATAEEAPATAAPEVPAEGPAASAATQMQAFFLKLWNVTRDDDLPADAKRERVRALLSSRLDEATLSRAALGPLAERFSPTEREAFHDAYAHYVVSLLVGRLARYPDHPVEVERASWDPERKVVRMDARGSAVVAGVPGVRRLTPRERIRLAFALREGSDGAWRVVALQMNEVDVSRNFRDQFRSVLDRSAPAALVAELEARNARNDAENPFE